MPSDMIINSNYKFETDGFPTATILHVRISNAIACTQAFLFWFFFAVLSKFRMMVRYVAIAAAI